ncbi:hypothetical protein EV2_033345 [Malus domestica]
MGLLLHCTAASLTPTALKPVSTNRSSSKNQNWSLKFSNGYSPLRRRKKIIALHRNRMRPLGLSLNLCYLERLLLI